MKVLKSIIISVIVCVIILGFVQICIADNLNIRIEESSNGAKLVLNHKGKKYELVLSPYSGNTGVADATTPNSNSNNGETTAPDTTADGSITLEQAKTIALNDAGLTQADFKKARQDYDDGRNVYEIEFVADSREYEYKIDSSTGRILDIDIDYNNKNYDNKDNSSDTAYNITAAEAESAALNSAGVSRSDVKYIYSYIDNDDKKTVYEVEFAVNNTKYEYKIDTSNGTILEQDIESH